MNQFAQVPMKAIGPIKIVGPVVNEEVLVPLATYEIPVWPSTNRGAKVSRESGGIFTTLIDERMTRSFAVEASNAAQALIVASQLKARKAELETVVAGDRKSTRLNSSHSQI